jgi:hypothetical protein
MPRKQIAKLVLIMISLGSPVRTKPANDGRSTIPINVE